MSEKKHPLSEEVEEELATAFLSYKDTITEILKPFSDEELLGFADGITSEEIHEAFEARHLVPRMVAAGEVGYRRIFARAKEVMDADPNVKAFCVAHDQDMSKCDPKDHE